MPEALILGPGGATAAGQDRTNYLLGPKQVRLDYTGGPTATDPVYVGTAPVGSAESAAVWTVQRLTYSGGNVVALDARTDVAWTARATPTPPWETPT